MAKIQRILIPVDFSAVSREAAHYAIQLGESFNPTIDVLHVWELPAVLGPDPLLQTGQGESQTLAEYTQKRVNEEMVSFLSDLENDINEAMDHHHTLHIKRRVESGRVGDKILEIAREEGHDLIVMGTHGRSGLAHLFMGSVTARVLREAPCPVLAVPPKKHQKAAS